MDSLERVLVTGGAGFIGSHTAKQLRQFGFEPVVYDNFSRGHRSLAKFGPVVEGDLHDSNALARALATYNPIACIHFAAFAYVAESVAKPELYYYNNVVGSLNLMRALMAAKVNKVVFSSTCAVYGQSAVLPIGEDLPKAPLSPYGKSKLMVEEMLLDFRRVHGLESVSLRYFNAAGSDPDGELGELHNPEPHIIPRALMAAAGKLDKLEVNGTDYPTRDGTAIRDYTHVVDLAKAHILALQYLVHGGMTDVFNLGIGHGYSINEIVTAVQSVTRRNIPVILGPRRPGDPAEVVADPTKAHRVLGFTPEYPELAQMIDHAWRWYSQHGFRED